MRNEMAIIVSPLIALMHNQVVALREMGVRTAYLHSSFSQSETSVIERNLLTGGIRSYSMSHQKDGSPPDFCILSSAHS
jgi:superfamily II DNA helicase RecQ